MTQVSADRHRRDEARREAQRVELARVRQLHEAVREREALRGEPRADPVGSVPPADAAVYGEMARRLLPAIATPRVLVEDARPALPEGEVPEVEAEAAPRPSRTAPPPQAREASPRPVSSPVAALAPAPAPAPVRPPSRAMPAPVAPAPVTVREAFDQGLHAAFASLSAEVAVDVPVEVPIRTPARTSARRPAELPARHEIVEPRPTAEPATRVPQSTARDPTAPVIADTPPSLPALQARSTAGGEAFARGRRDGLMAACPPAPAIRDEPIEPRTAPRVPRPVDTRQAFREGHASVLPRRDEPRTVTRHAPAPAHTAPVSSPQYPPQPQPQPQPEPQRPPQPPTPPQVQQPVPPPPPVPIAAQPAELAVAPVAVDRGNQESREDTAGESPGDHLQSAQQRLDAHLATLTAAQQLAKGS